jgi:type I restriction enzyme S subunit
MKEAKDMKEGWEYKKLGEVADFYRGLTYGKQDEAISSDVCVLRSNNIDMESMSLNFDEIKYLSPDFVIPEDKKLKGNSIFICMSNGSKQHVGKVAFVENDMDYAFGGFMGLITPSKEVSAKYVYYACRSPLYRVFLTSIGNGIGITNLKFTDLYNFSFPMPKLSHQQQIVSELDLLSGVIEKQKTQLEELDKLAQSIFYDMFGDPVTNEKGWEMKKLGEECEDMKYGTSRPACENGRYKYLRMGNITLDGHLDLADLKTIDIPEEEVEKCIVRYGDILFNRTNSHELIGKTCMFDLDEPMIIAGYIIRVRLSENLKSIFISIMFNLPSMKKLLRSIAKGAVNQANINSKELASINIIIPPLSLQQEFAAKEEAIEAMKAKVRQSLKEAETLFNSRMDYYFN